MSQYLSEQINALLPQTQCGKCGYTGCKPYAEAIANGTPINQCPPGGRQTLEDLANLLSLPVTQLNPRHGAFTEPKLAVIRETECIGCTKCIQACPVDAILGSAKQMHSVIASECTGCELCVEPCPVDCIDMITGTSSSSEKVTRRQSDFWRQRFERRQSRSNIQKRTPMRNLPVASTTLVKLEKSAAQKEIAAALARVKAREPGYTSRK